MKGKLDSKTTKHEILGDWLNFSAQLHNSSRFWFKHLVVFFFTLILTAACSPTSDAQPPLIAGTQPSDSSVYSLSEDSYEVEAWVSDPTPNQDEQVFVYGSLIRNGVRVGGMMMRAYWPDEKQAPGIPGCNVLVIYGSGGCILEASKFPAGEFVPVRVQFEYYGETYSGETGFTPQ
jgi:hypothetical protein